MCDITFRLQNLKYFIRKKIYNSIYFVMKFIIYTFIYSFYDFILNVLDLSLWFAVLIFYYFVYFLKRNEKTI